MGWWATVVQQGVVSRLDALPGPFYSSFRCAPPRTPQEPPSAVFAYWLLFGVFALGAMTERPFAHWQQHRRDPLFIVAIVFLAIIVGLRSDVGGDWGAYLRQFRLIAYMDLPRALNFGDPGYNLLSWTAQQLGAGIWLVNLVCGSLFAWGLYRLALTQPSPWLTIVIAIPYLVIVVAMGYTRQGVAIGILMAGLARFQFHGSVLRFAAYVAIAALFHRTAVVALPLVALGGRRNFAINLVVLAFTTVALYDLLVASSMDRFVENYVRTDLGSQGAAIRVSMSVVPAALCLAVGDRLGFSPREAAMWRNFSYGSLIALIGLALYSSTVVDRLALYLLPLQLAIIPRLSGVIGSRTSGMAIVIGYAIAIQFTWLNFSNYAVYWVPYHFYPLAS